MSEQQYQSKIIKDLELEGYFTIKIIKANKNGIPDILAIKDGMATFIEVKSKDGRVSEIQKYRIEQLKKYGARAFVMQDGKTD